MLSESPPGSCHFLDVSDLAAPDVRFFALRDGAEVVGMGAWRRIAPDHGELKSMHVAAARRGGGLARPLLDHLLADMRAAGVTRASLETGSQPAFEPARALYARAGFEECPPFGDYRPDPASCFMTRAL